MPVTVGRCTRPRPSGPPGGPRSAILTGHEESVRTPRPARGAGFPQLAAVLWDLDGTLVDTEPHWMSAELELAAAHHAAWTPADALSAVGRPLSITAELLRSRGVRLGLASVLTFLVDRVGAALAEAVPWQPGVPELLAAVRAAAVPMALVTSSPAVLADPVARAAGVFETVVAREDVTRYKPDPEPYLVAVDRLGVAAADCVVIEDSASGIASALAAGAHVLAVPGLAAPAGVASSASLRLVGVEELQRVQRGEVLHLPQAAGD